MPRAEDGVSNQALSEALFQLAETEPDPDRRLPLLEAAYAVFDAQVSPRRALAGTLPGWLEPLVDQLLDCPGRGALEAAVGRLGGPRQPPGRPTRANFLARRTVEAILAAAPSSHDPRRLRGAMHWHTRASDGHASLERMAHDTRRRGFSWAVVADHSWGLEPVGGLSPKDILRQADEVQDWNDRYASELRLFQGLEIEIKGDGQLDVPREIRAELDVVFAAVHSCFDPDRDQTERLLAALRAPEVDVLAHPRARLFGRRSGIRARWEVVFAAAAEAEVAIEINGIPRRQDLDWELAALAAKAGCMFVLASDAHKTAHLDYDRVAVAIAVRAGIPAERILNFRSEAAFESWLLDRD